MNYYFIGPMGKQGSEERIWFRYIRRLLEDSVDCEVGTPEDEILSLDIVHKLVVEFEKSDLIFVDVSIDNPNVFLELGIVISMGKPFQLLMLKDRINDGDIPIDAQNFGVIPLPNSLSTYENDVLRFKKDEAVAASKIRKAIPPKPNPSHHISEAVKAFIQKSPNDREKSATKGLSQRLEAKTKELNRISRLFSTLSPKLDQLLDKDYRVKRDPAKALAKSLLKKRKYKDAIEILNLLLDDSSDADKPSIYLEMAVNYHDLESYHESLECIESALAMNPSFPEAVKLRGQCELKLKNERDDR